jgi:DNA-directed RNA polymerase specialized sigma24 family protein
MSAATSAIFSISHEARTPYGTERGTLDERFPRCRRTLHFLAHRILTDPEMAARAVENCWLRASRNPPSFESEGAFGSWIMRLLIWEAACILHQVGIIQGI